MGKRKATKTKTLTKVPKKKPEVPEFAYTIKDKVFGELKVLNSANAWWLDMQKLEQLINAFKYDCTYEEACISAGISLGQLRYFVDNHKEFLQVIAACREVPNLKARQTVVAALATDNTTARWYLERKKAGEFGVKPPLLAVQINMGDMMAQDRKEFEAVEVEAVDLSPKK